MKVQYFGDVNDYRKFALLRLLAKEGGFRIGVNWMLTKDDGGPDGAKRSYLSQPQQWRDFDPVLFDALKSLKLSAADFHGFETTELIPGAIFFGKETPDPLVDRNQFHRDCLSAFADAELAFFDPDNGLEIASCPKGRKRSSKFVFCDEIADHYGKGRSILIYQHFPHLPRAAFIENRSTRLGARLPQSQVVVFETAHVAFVLAARPHHATRVQAAAAEAHKRFLPDLFTRIHSPKPPER